VQFLYTDDISLGNEKNSLNVQQIGRSAKQNNTLQALIMQYHAQNGRKNTTRKWKNTMPYIIIIYPFDEK